MNSLCRSPQGGKKHGHGHGHGHGADKAAAAGAEETARLLSSGDEEQGDSGGDQKRDSGIALQTLSARRAAVDAQAVAGTALPLLVLDDMEETGGGGGGNYSFLPEPEVK